MPDKIKCDWVEVRVDLRIPPDVPEPTEEQWQRVAEIFRAKGFTGTMKSYRKFNSDA